MVRTRRLGFRLALSSSLLFVGLGPACQQPTGRGSDASGRSQVDVSALLDLAVEVQGNRPRSLRWWDDEHYLVHASSGEEGPAQLWKVAAQNGERRPLYDAGRMEAALAALPGFDEQAPRQARRSDYQWTQVKDAVSFRHGDGVYYYHFASGQARRLLDSQTDRGEDFSPDGRWMAFLREQDIYLVSTDSAEVRRLTEDGAPELRLNGWLDWVYQEEVYGRGNFKGFWWSPNSEYIAFLQLDESPVGEFRVEDHIPVLGRQEIYRYPKAGEPNPRVKLGCVSIVDGSIRWFDLSNYDPDDRLIVQVDWTPAGDRVLMQVTNRIQDRLDLLFGDPASGQVVRAFREESDCWVRRSPIHWVADGSFLWSSSRDGWQHLYRYDASGQLLGQLTSGDFEVLSVNALSPDRRFVFATTNESSILERQLWRIALDGSEREQLTRGRGRHRVRLSPNGRWGLNTWSHAGDPGDTVLLDLRNGETIRTLSRGRRELLARHGYRPPEFLQVPNRRGFTMEAKLWKPPGFDPNRKYPVLVYTYGGPHAPSVRDAWGGFRSLWHEALSREGYLVWVCDNQSASGKGREAAGVMYERAGQTELRDIEAGLEWLLAQGFADEDRIGIWGWSYGGYMASYALTHSESFRMGIAGAPVTDWRNYDTIYTERYMNTPQSNPQGYEAGSVLEAADRLHGELLLIHGTIDENVHMSNSLQLAHALQKAGKPFELMLYPRNRHGIVDREQREHLYELMTDFILRRL